MTSQGSASGRFTRAIQQRNLFAADVALKEVGNPSLLVALDYLVLLIHGAAAEVPAGSVALARPLRARGDDAHTRRVATRAVGPR